MTNSSSAASFPRLLAPTIIVAVALAIRFVPSWVAPLTLFHFIGLGVGPALGVLGLLVWWVLARRVPLRDRLLGLGYALALIVLGFVLGHKTMTQVQVSYGFVLLAVAMLAAFYLTRARPWPARRGTLAAVFAVVWLPFLLLRQDGQIGELTPELAMRWAPTAEERFLEERRDATAGRTGAGPGGPTAAEWPGFRGPERDARVLGVSFSTDWSAEPPRERWRRRVGPGWSSFAVAGDRAFTQEQRGPEEVVVAYSLTDGSELWVHADASRFEEAAAGPGPRATPTFHDGRIYALGASGALYAIDAATGNRLWRRSLVDDVGAPLPVWGFSSSPLVAGDAVLVFAGAEDGKSVVAYRRDSGRMLWSAGDGGYSYGSVHLADIAGSEQALMSTDHGLQSFDPATGELLWEFSRPLPGMARIVQPVVLGDGSSVILATGYGEGSVRLALSRDGAGEWSVEEVWSSKFLKPYFNGLACHEATCYGFDGKILTAIGADDGQRRWKGGRYGHGQLVLVPDMDLLLVITEKGEVVLVEATPEAHREVARFQAIAGKTWNHPVVAQGKLLVRNAEEAACFDLPT